MAPILARKQPYLTSYFDFHWINNKFTSFAISLFGVRMAPLCVCVCVCENMQKVRVELGRFTSFDIWFVGLFIVVIGPWLVAGSIFGPACRAIIAVTNGLQWSIDGGFHSLVASQLTNGELLENAIWQCQIAAQDDELKLMREREREASQWAS